jgi:hypothetical protein
MTHLRRVHPTLVRFVPPKMIPNGQYRRRGDAIELAYVVPPEDIPAVESDHDDDAAEGGAAIGDSSGISESNAPQGPRATTVYYPDAGNPHGDTFDLDDDEIDPFRPFDSEQEYQLARWAVKHHVTKAATNDLMAIPGMNDVSGATSAYTLFKGVDTVVNDLQMNSWQRKFVSFDMSKDGKKLTDDELTPFWYRDPVRCIEFLMKQPAYKEDIAYAPSREYNDAGERMYSEINSGDWWWRMQVSTAFFKRRCQSVSSLTTVNSPDRKAYRCNYHSPDWKF